MALIGKIRKRVGLLIVFVGISMVLFILGDLVTSNTGLLHRNSDVVGVINGEKVRYPEFQKRYELLIENYKANQQTENVDQNTQDMMREQAWNMYVNELTLGEQYKILGLSCSDKELYEMVTGKDPHPQIRQAFTDPKTKTFDPATVVKFLKDLPNREEKIQRQWKQFEDAIREERVAQKYKDLIKGGLFVTDLEAKMNNDEAQRKATIHYVRLEYNTIADSTVKVTDEDLTAAYNKNKSKYKQQETMRKLDYVTFEVTPSEQDRADIMDWITKKKDEFVQSTNDTIFVAQYSDTPLDSTLHAQGSLPPALDTVFFNAPVGTVIGPYQDGGSLKISKLIVEKFIPDSVKARHILLSIEGNDTLKAKNLADSLKTAIKKGANFGILALTYSKDQGSAMKGGDLGWFRQNVMVKPFNDACFEGNKGDMPIVVSQFGVHLIEILEKGKPTKQIQVATVERKLEPSQKTFDAVYNKANLFAASNNTGALYDSACIKMGLSKRIADNLRETDRNVAGLEQPRELIRWAYEAKTGDVSKAFVFGDKYVIAHLLEVKEKGTLPLEVVKEPVQAEAIKQKKADMLIEKIKATGATSIDAIAQKLNVTATDANDIIFQNSFLPNIGGEPQLVGMIFAMKAGQVSQPVRGESGVIVFEVKSFTEPPAVKDYSANIKQIAEQRKSRSEYEVFSALKEKANMEDNRGRFY